MNEKHFKYAVLKYRPSYWLDEQINIGLLFFFETDSKVEFLFPSQLKRIHDLYPKANLSVIRSYLRAFKNRAGHLSKNNLFLGVTQDTILESEFLIPDANAFFFSKIKTGFYHSREELLEYYYNSYFSYYYGLSKGHRKDEQWISQKFTQYLKKESAEKLVLFQKPIKLENERAHAQFDLTWQNGTLNLVRPIGFDLQKGLEILDKSNLWFAKLTGLKKELELGGYKVDFLVSTPHEASKEQKKYFDRALKVLKSIEIQRDIFKDDELKDYAKYALESVKDTI